METGLFIVHSQNNIIMNKISNQIKWKLNSYSCLFFLFLVFLSSSGCKKFLDKKPVKTDVIPSTLQDLQSLLDRRIGNNASGLGAMCEILSDNAYVTTADWQLWLTIVPQESANYIWDGTSPTTDAPWFTPYQFPIYYSNIVLDQLPLVTTQPGEEGKYNSIKGSALFYRAFYFWGLAQVYCKPYATNHANDLGIVLKLTSNVSEKVTRATIQQTYDRIIADLKESVDLLPTTTTFPTRPTKAAAYGMLARTYLSMRDYINAGNYANLALQQYSTLIDYNTRVPVSNPPMPTFNAEVVFHNVALFIDLLDAFHKIDSLLYQSYDINDLRKQVFFRAGTGANLGTYTFQGSYHGTGSRTSVFDGITTGELYLTRAECYARAGNKDAALADLNALMTKRWKSGSFTNITATDAADALYKVLIERRKELVFRGQRWSDIRRFNLEDANITLKRIIAGITYTLPPNDPRSALLIPFTEINRSGIQQNPR